MRDLSGQYPVQYLGNIELMMEESDWFDFSYWPSDLSHVIKSGTANGMDKAV